MIIWRKFTRGTNMEKVISVEHLHKHLKNIYFHGSEGEFHMEFSAATAETAKYIRSSFNAFMVHAPGNMNFDVDNNLSDKVKTGELGVGAVRVSGNISMALTFLLSRRLVNAEIHKLIVEDKDLTSFLQQSSLYKSSIEELDSGDEEKQSDVIVKDVNKTSVDSPKSPATNKSNKHDTVISSDSSVDFSIPTSPRSTKVK